MMIDVPASAETGEAAAMVAAVEQFLADTAPAAPPAAESINPWQRAALVEGTSSKLVFGPGAVGSGSTWR